MLRFSNSFPLTNRKKNIGSVIWDSFTMQGISVSLIRLEELYPSNTHVSYSVNELPNINTHTSTLTHYSQLINTKFFLETLILINSRRSFYFQKNMQTLITRQNMTNLDKWGTMWIGNITHPLWINTSVRRVCTAESFHPSNRSKTNLLQELKSMKSRRVAKSSVKYRITSTKLSVQEIKHCTVSDFWSLLTSQFF